jgi:hypothetical protein
LRYRLGWAGEHRLDGAIAPIAHPALEAMLAVDPKNMESRYDLAAALAGRARIEAQLAASTASIDGWRQARASYAQSLVLWRALDGRAISEGRFEAGLPALNVRSAEAGVRKCDAMLHRPQAR